MVASSSTAEVQKESRPVVAAWSAGAPVAQWVISALRQAVAAINLLTYDLSSYQTSPRLVQFAQRNALCFASRHPAKAELLCKGARLYTDVDVGFF